LSSCVPNRCIVAAHRGASRLAPENTIAAFQQAISMGARALELDVHLTRDERVAVLHDSLLERTTNGAGPVRKLTADEITALDAGSWYRSEFAGQSVPFLEDVLRLTGGRTRLHIELKGEHGDLLAGRVVDEVKRSQATAQVLIMSFDLNAALAASRASSGVIPVLPIVSRQLEDQFEFVRSTGLSGLNQAPKHWRAQTITRFHEHDLIVHGSLINDPVKLAEFFAMGGDTADSDEPACFGGPAG
jgi:glycerophosphoryl diester phosphodiesterase